ncbi:MAG TPA: DNA polymerase III subunit beta, partial [Microbacterium sp.]|nr:DNA polymerase III subunit beta [Microbacterium sp.]
MKFHVNRDVFSEAVSFVVKLLPQRNPQPILAGVLIEASEEGLSLAAFDYEASARTTIEATVDEPGTILVHGRLLSEIASRLPNAPIQIAVGEDDGIVLTCGSARFTLASMPVQEYPAIPEVSGESGLVPAEEFATAIAQVAFAASRDDVTPVLTGVQLEVSGTTLSLVATDRYRVALRDVSWDEGSLGSAAAGDDSTTALVPARTLTEVGKTFAHSGDIQVSFSGSGDREIIAFTSGNKTVTSLLIKGNFPPVRRLFPEQTDHYAVVNTAELAEAVRRVSLVLDRSAPLRFTFSEDGVSMDASGTEQAR